MDRLRRARIDDESRRQRWTPRKKTSHWSRVNLDLVEKLRAEGRMQPSGLAIWEQRHREEAPYSHERPWAGLPDSYRRGAGCVAGGHCLLGGVDRDLPQGLRRLGHLGQAGRHPRPPDGTADRVQRRGRARAEPTLRRRSAVVGAGRGCRGRSTSIARIPRLALNGTTRQGRTDEGVAVVATICQGDAMSRRIDARVALATAALIALAGCRDTRRPGRHDHPDEPR